MTIWTNPISTANMVTAAIKAGDSYLWNGPVCPTCRRGYIGTHECDPADLERQITALLAEVKRLRRPKPHR